ncbi:MAG: SDR family oxidoreductase, partial [Thaumarchaeota archaeon]|nr:SDR family oxidoreductase [Nitrososphaerota archaeon]
GIEGLVRSASATYASKNIRINAIAPSLTNTKLANFITKNPNALEASKAMHPLNRIGEVSVGQLGFFQVRVGKRRKFYFRL